MLFSRGSAPEQQLSAALYELSTLPEISDNFGIDREYLWNGSSNQQAENGVINYDFFTFEEINSVNLGLITKNDLNL